MENLKTKGIFTLLFTLTIFLTLTLGNVFAVDRIFELTATYNGKTLSDGQTLTIESNDSRTISISVDPKYTDTLQIGYKWDSDSIKIAAEGSKTATVTIPNFAAGSSHTLKLEAIINDKTNNYIGNSNVVTLTIKIPAATTVTADLKNGNTTVSNGATIEKAAGTTLTIVTSSNKTVKQIAYRWNSEELKTVNGSSATLTVPNYAEGSSNKLSIQAVTEDNVYSTGKTYTIKIPVKTTITVDLKNGNTVVSNGATIEKTAGSSLSIVTSSNKTVEEIAYRWNSEELKTVKGSSATITVPSYAAGSSNKLSIQAVTEDDVYSAGKTYTVKIPAATTVSIDLKNGSTVVSNGATIEKAAGTTLTIVTSSNKTVKQVSYRWNSEELKTINGSTTTITVPSYAAGSSNKLAIQAVTEDGVYSTGKTYTVKLPVATTISVDLKDGNKVVSNGSTIEKDVGSKLTITATSNKTVKQVSYRWNSEALKIVNGSSVTITVPSYAAGSTNKLAIQAMTEDDKISEGKMYTIQIPKVEALTGDFTVSYNGKVLANNSTTTIAKGSKVKVVGSPAENFMQISGKWETSASSGVIATAGIVIPGGAAIELDVPASEGQTIKLILSGTLKDGGVTNTKTYIFKIPKPEALTGDVLVEYEGKTLANNSTTTISIGKKVKIKGEPATNFTSISGEWQINPSTGDTAVSGIVIPGSSMELEIPGAEGQTIKLVLSGLLKDNGNTETKTYIFEIPTAGVKPLTGEVIAKNGNSELSEGFTNEFAVGTQLTLVGTPADNFVKITYKWDNESSKDITGSNGKINVPNFKAGSEHTLTITATLKDGTVVSEKVYKIKIPAAGEEPQPPEEKLTGEIAIRLNGKTLSNNSTNTVFGGETLTLIGTPIKNFAKLIYRWDEVSESEAPGGTVDITVLANEGITHTLKVYGILTDGGKTSTKTYHFVVEELDDLTIEPWMREDDDAEGLIVSLRNDTEEEKANKNFYMIDEEVIYYVDYKNCGEDIEDEVKLVLELPLKFDTVDSAAGVISKSDKTITWIFENGLLEGQAGTKEVVVRYTELSKDSYDYEIVYPQARIYEESKKKDTSAVINYIYLSESTVIEDEHEPYMYGDADNPTFRPDDTISRAEGALVLTRIFGIKTSNVKITDKYSDINDTYKEAQRAIMAASELGIINGYEDGTYRPREKMTRAEFMKIIASYIEVMGEDEGIDGLELKEDSSIKAYKNTANRNHWAVKYVTLLVRLNMTPVSESNKDLRLNDEITRAEVAQLVNFYLLRAPAKVTSSTKTDFIDVSKSHKLFADIVEATRPTHSFVITDDGREREK